MATFDHDSGDLLYAAGLAIALSAACGDDSASAGTEASTGSSTNASTGECVEFGRQHCLPTDSSGNSSFTGPGEGTTLSLDSSGSSSSEGGEESTGEPVPVDCENLQALPIGYSVLGSPTASEDFVFGPNGNLVNVADGGNLLRAPHGGVSTLWFPGVGVDASGTAMLTNGDVVFADSGANTVVHVDGAGSTQTIAAGVAYPNGLTVDMNDNVYVAENSGGRVLRINPTTLSVETVAEGLFSPNGLAFDSTYENLYIGSFGGGTVHRFNVATGTTSLFASGIGDGGLDGVIVDACGNVYVTDFGPATIYRLNGVDIELVVDLSADAFWIPNLHFGSGVGGWDETLLYVMDRGANQVYVLDLGVRGVDLPHL